MANPLYDAIFGRNAGREAPFLILPDGQTISHRAFLDRAARFANALDGMGVRAGDRVAVQIDKSPDALAVYAGCARAGVVFLPLNTAYTPAELAYFVENSGAALFLCAPDRAAALAPVAERAGARLATLGTRGDGSLAAAADAASDRFHTVDCGPDDLAALLYTSGTTGRSKGAMMSHRNLVSNARTLAELWRFTEADVLLHALPIYHTHGLFVATNIVALTWGAMIFLPKLDIDALIGWMPQATSLMGVPTFYTRLLEDPRFDRDLAAHMRLFVSGSAPLLAETHRQFEARTGHRILERYGMTETGMNTSNPYDGDRRAGTVGLPLPGVEVRVLGEGDAMLPAGEIGGVEVRGPNVFGGYWRMPEKTAEDLRPDGFFRTGDLGRFDADGYLTIVGRSKDLIIAGGFNIYPKEVELVLDTQPGIRESAVIGVPHPDLGEAVVAILVPEPGATPDLGAIEAAVAAALARFKQPRRYELVTDLPRNTMGKVQKNLLRETYRGVFGT